jgi:hypothetical protein
MTGERRNAYCEELATLIAACDADDPDPELLARIEAHIDECDLCESAEAALTRQVVAFRDAEPAAVSTAFESDLVNRLCKNVPGRGQNHIS